MPIGFPSSRFCARTSRAASFPSSPPMPFWRSGSVRSTCRLLRSRWGRCARSSPSDWHRQPYWRNSSMLGGSVVAVSRRTFSILFISAGISACRRWRITEEPGGFERQQLHCPVGGAEAFRHGDGEALGDSWFAFKAPRTREHQQFGFAAISWRRGQLLIQDPRWRLIRSHGI